MNTADQPEIAELLDRVRDWPVPLRIALARRILEATETPEPPVSVPPKTKPIEQVISLLRTAGPPPDDEECRRIVEEERMKRSG